MGTNVVSLVRKPSDASIVRAQLETRGFEFGAVNYAFWQAKGHGLTITFYTSGKLVIQGVGAEQLAQEILTDEQNSFGLEHLSDLSAWIGTDESGKGDFFGPLVVAAVHVTPESARSLTLRGAQDSKSMSEARLLELARTIRRTYPYAIASLDPVEYNQAYNRVGNLNHILADLHTTAIAELVTKTHCKTILTDQFAYKEVLENRVHEVDAEIRLVQQHRAETNPGVAAASVLARAAFLERLKKLGQQFYMTFPRGAGNVVPAGRAFVKQYGLESLNQVAKMHFKTVKKLI